MNNIMTREDLHEGLRFNETNNDNKYLIHKIKNNTVLVSTHNKWFGVSWREIPTEVIIDNFNSGKYYLSDPIKPLRFIKQHTL